MSNYTFTVEHFKTNGLNEKEMISEKICETREEAVAEAVRVFKEEYRSGLWCYVDVVSGLSGKVIWENGRFVR